jgi:multicomponent Na+:H+ antiporter subunit E
VRSVAYVVTLAAIWVLLWGSASPANVLSGLAVGAVLVVLVPGLRKRRAPGRARLRPLAILRFLGEVLKIIVTSNVELIREVISPRRSLHTAIVGVPLPGCSDELLTLITNLLALSPGTMPIELRPDPPVLYLHVLHLRDIDSVRHEVQRLTDLAVRAFGTDETIAEQDAYLREHPL